MSAPAYREGDPSDPDYQRGALALYSHISALGRIVEAFGLATTDVERDIVIAELDAENARSLQDLGVSSQFEAGWVNADETSGPLVGMRVLREYRKQCQRGQAC